MTLLQRARRFPLSFRMLHWSIAIPALVCLSSGLGLRWGWTFGGQTNHFLLRQVHIVSGLVTLGAPVAVIGATRVRRRAWTPLVTILGSMAGSNRSDEIVITNTQRRFAGCVCAGLVLSAVSGVELWKWPWFPLSARVAALTLHEAIAAGLLLWVAAHLYLTTLHPSTRWTFPGMVTGSVDAASLKSFAERHRNRVVRKGNNPLRLRTRLWSITSRRSACGDALDDRPTFE